jgi:hypothetical protein
VICLSLTLGLHPNSKAVPRSRYEGSRRFGQLCNTVLRIKVMGSNVQPQVSLLNFPCFSSGHIAEFRTTKIFSYVDFILFCSPTSRSMQPAVCTVKVAKGNTDVYSKTRRACYVCVCVCVCAVNSVDISVFPNSRYNLRSDSFSIP